MYFFVARLHDKLIIIYVIAFRQKSEKRMNGF